MSSDKAVAIKIEDMSKSQKKPVRKVAFEKLQSPKQRYYFFAALQYDKLFKFRVARENGDIIGFSCAVGSRLGGIVINHLIVKTGYEHHGVVEMLLEDCLDSNPGETFTLQVRESDTDAQKIYAKYDFEQVGSIKNHYPIKGSFRREDAIIMEYDDKDDSED